MAESFLRLSLYSCHDEILDLKADLEIPSLMYATDKIMSKMVHFHYGKAVLATTHVYDRV